MPAYRMFTLIIDGKNLGQFKVPNDCQEMYFFRNAVLAAEKKLGEHLPPATKIEIYRKGEITFLWKNEWGRDAWSDVRQLGWP